MVVLWLWFQVDDESDEIEEGRQEVATEEILDFVNNTNQPEISLHALISSLNPKTMRIKGRIGN